MIENVIVDPVPSWSPSADATNEPVRPPTDPVIRCNPDEMGGLVGSIEHQPVDRALAVDVATERLACPRRGSA